MALLDLSIVACFGNCFEASLYLVFRRSLGVRAGTIDENPRKIIWNKFAENDARNFVFGNFIGVKTGVPYLLFAMTGLTIWSYFSFVMTNAGASIIASQGMIKKIYFPRLIIPLSKAAVGLIDLSI